MLYQYDIIYVPETDMPEHQHTAADWLGLGRLKLVLQIDNGFYGGPEGQNTTAFHKYNI